MLIFSITNRIHIVSPLIYIFIVVSMPLRRKFILKRAGNRILAVNKKNTILPVLIMLSCAVLMAIIQIKKLGTTTDIIVLLIATLGAAMGSSEISLNGSEGVYTNGLIGSGHFLPLSEIYALPAYDELQKNPTDFNHKVLKIVTDRRGAVSFFYSTPEECKSVIEALVKLSPSLKGNG
ncbi:MAG: hypothetical protein ACTTKX_00590 [Treponema sp.]